MIKMRLTNDRLGSSKHQLVRFAFFVVAVLVLVLSNLRSSFQLNNYSIDSVDKIGLKEGETLEDKLDQVFEAKFGLGKNETLSDKLDQAFLDKLGLKKGETLSDKTANFSEGHNTSEKEAQAYNNNVTSVSRQASASIGALERVTIDYFDEDTILQQLDDPTSLVHKLSSPACVPFRYNHTTSNADFYEDFWSGRAVQRPTKIKLLHMRKAGGTTLYRYFKRVVRSRKTGFDEFSSCEGNRRCLDLNDYHDGYLKYANSTDRKTIGWDDSGSTLYVTHLREPVARALSNYKYGLRFECQNAFAEDFVPPSLEEQIMTLEEFVNRTTLNKMDQYYPIERRLWNCNSNCYARWVTGMDNPLSIIPGDSKRLVNPHKGLRTRFNRTYSTISKFYYKTNQTTKYARALSLEALKLLLRYDLIIVLEWLQTDPDYARLIEDVFFNGVRGLGRSMINHCSKSMQKINELVPLKITNTTRKQLEIVNDIDSKLYNVLTSCER